MVRALLLALSLFAALPAAASLPPSELAAVPAKAGPGDETKAFSIADSDDAGDKLPTRAKVKECCGYPIAKPADFRLSFYWLAYESEYANEKYDVDIYSREGSGILRDGRVVNYDGACAYGIGTCFKTLDPTEHPLGRGVQARPLEPFRSIAVDPRYIPIGAPVYVPEIVGLVLPDGTRHDGCLRADDQGGAIKLHKLDFFVESYFNFKFMADQLWWKLKATPHLDEPRCEYLRLRHPREFDNDRSDWAMLHSKKLRQALAAKHNASKHSVWALKRHRKGGKAGGAHGKGKLARRK